MTRIVDMGLAEWVGHLARLGLKGDAESVRIHLRRAVRRDWEELPGLREALKTELANNPDPNPNRFLREVKAERDKKLGRELCETFEKWSEFFSRVAEPAELDDYSKSWFKTAEEIAERWIDPLEDYGPLHITHKREVLWSREVSIPVPEMGVPIIGPDGEPTGTRSFTAGGVYREEDDE